MKEPGRFSRFLCWVFGHVSPKPYKPSLQEILREPDGEETLVHVDFCVRCGDPIP